jgi:hypothetical protein
MLNDVEAMLALADEHISEIEAMYQATLTAQAVPPRLQAHVKGVIEQQRSALDFVAHEVAITHGTAREGDRIYWPYAKDSTQFDQFFDKNLPGVRQSQPAILDAWRKYQPYTRGYEWIADLVDLARGNKHRRLTPQTRTERRATRFQAPGGGAAMEIGEGASVQIGRGAQVLIGGVPIQHIQPQRITYVGWAFADTGKPALATLKNIQKGIRPVLHDLCDLAGL